VRRLTEHHDGIAVRTRLCHEPRIARRAINRA
jgi:hypothetical protein